METMSRRIRSFQLVAIIALLAMLLPTVSTAGGAAPGLHPGNQPGLAQSTTGGYPATVVLQGQQFLFDRIVPLDPQELAPLEAQGAVTLYARSDAPPFPAIYAVVTGAPSGDGLARYLPTTTSSPDSPCLAENTQVGSITSGDQLYAFAGIETDIPAETLVEVANAEGQPVYADPGAAQPAPELLVASDQGLLRFILTTADGVPMPLSGSVVFGDQTYAFSADVTDSTDPLNLAKIGCTGPFPAYAAIDAQAPIATIMVLVNGRYLSFNATGAAPAAPTAPENTSPTPENGVPADATSPPITDTNANDAVATVTSSTDETAGDQSAGATQTTDGANVDQTVGGTPTTENQNNEAGFALDVNDNLGTSGQPDGLPREFLLGADRFQFDRVVALSAEGLSLVAQQGALTAYARTAQEPFNAIFVAIPGTGDGSLARYLPERIAIPDTACPVEANNIGLLQTGDASYAFAGNETDLSTEALQQIGDSNGATVYADPDAGQPFPEVFIADPNGLQRFVLLNDLGLPAPFSQSLVFNGIEYALVGDVTDQTDRSTLPKLGCAGPFPVYAGADATGANGNQRFVLVDTRLFLFEADGALPVEGTPTDVAPTEAAVTATATPIPATPSPSATPVPPTETAVPPTEIPTATVLPTDTPVPPTETLVPPTNTAIPTETRVSATVTVAPETETPVPTEKAVSPTAAPASPVSTGTVVPSGSASSPAATATEAPTMASPAVATPGMNRSLSAEEAQLPTQLTVQETTYIFAEVDVTIDIQTLVQVEVMTVQGIEVTVYATQPIQDVVPELYCVSRSGDVVGRYVVAAAAQPPPPAELPATVEAQGNTYVFNQVNVDIDITTLVQIEVVVVQNVELTLYSEQSVQGAPRRIFAVAPNGTVTGQYVESSLIVTLQPAPVPTIQFQPPAVVPTQAPNVPAPAAVTALPTNQCPGSPGPLDAQGLPAYLPNRIQLNGIAYTFKQAEAANVAGTLTKIRCIGAFEAATTDKAEETKVVYLRLTGIDAANQQVYRFEAALTFTVEIEVTGQSREIRVGDQPSKQFLLSETWQPVIYSSTTVLLFTKDVENANPDVYFAVNVQNTVVGEVIGEYRKPGETSQPSDAMTAAAAKVGINPDLTINGQLYILVNLYYPIGTTTNGFVTIFSNAPDGNADLVLARDKRERELFIYRVRAVTGG